MLSRLLLSCCIVAGIPLAPASGDTTSSDAIEWNAAVLAAAEAEDGFLTLKGVRTAAMLHVAAHDALNAIDSRYQPYAFMGTDAGASPAAAAASAAYEVARNQFPDRIDDWKRLIDAQVAGVDDADAAARGRALGRAAAAAVLKLRSEDGHDGEASYAWHPMAPGVYAEFSEHSATPEGFVFGAGWAQADPFLLEAPDEFRVPPPPPIGSAAYTRAFDEVKSIGSADASNRSDDQTHLALWWKDFVENSHNRLARQLIAREGLDAWHAHRVLALLNLSVFDAYVSVFDNKFFYNHWRPYTAIRWAAHDGNPATIADPDWNNTHGHTYAFPSYPSAHGCASAAAMTVLADTFGDGYAFTMTTSRVDRAGPFSGKMEMDPSARSFESFSEAAWECALSRVYLGIHFRYDSVEGVALGNRVGRRAVGSFLLPSSAEAP